MYYYRDKDAREIDIVLEHDGILNPLEIKKTSNPGSELTKVFALHRYWLNSIFSLFGPSIVKNLTPFSQNGKKWIISLVVFRSA